MEVEVAVRVIRAPRLALILRDLLPEPAFSESGGTRPAYS